MHCRVVSVLLVALSVPAYLGGCSSSSDNTVSGGGGDESGGNESGGNESGGNESGGNESGGGGAESAGSPSIGDFTLGGPCPTDERVGGFSLRVSEDDKSASFDGHIDNGIDPIRVLESIAEMDGCRLARVPHLVCDPSCSSGKTCNSSGECQAMARGQDVGTVTLLGLETKMSLQPSKVGNSYFAEVPNPPVAAGEKVQVSTTDGYAGELTLHGYGVTQLELLTGRLALSADEELLIRWVPPSDPTNTRVTLELSVDQHGSTPAQLFCDFEDSGEVAVPSALMAGLLEAGVTGYPQAILERRTVDSTAVPDGCAEFVVASRRTPSVAIAGYTPCRNTSQCPDGESCNTALERCE